MTLTDDGLRAPAMLRRRNHGGGTIAGHSARAAVPRHSAVAVNRVEPAAYAVGGLGQTLPCCCTPLAECPVEGTINHQGTFLSAPRRGHFYPRLTQVIVGVDKRVAMLYYIICQIKHFDCKHP